MLDGVEVGDPTRGPASLDVVLAERGEGKVRRDLVVGQFASKEALERSWRFSPTTNRRPTPRRRPPIHLTTMRSPALPRKPSVRTLVSPVPDKPCQGEAEASHQGEHATVASSTRAQRGASDEQNARRDDCQAAYHGQQHVPTVPRVKPQDCPVTLKLSP